MRIVVCSDSHGDVQKLMLAMDQQPNAGAYVFLGDGIRDAEILRSRGKPAVFVKGNCDGLPCPVYETLTLAGKTILCTHGHHDQVKFGLDILLYRARERGVDICLFGHTHVPYIGYEEGVHLFNPGSIQNGDYGFVDIVPGGVVCRHVKVRDIF